MMYHKIKTVFYAEKKIRDFILIIPFPADKSNNTITT